MWYVDRAKEARAGVYKLPRGHGDRSLRYTWIDRACVASPHDDDLGYDSLEFECGLLVPLASVLLAGVRNDAATTTSLYDGREEPADLPAEDPGELPSASGSVGGGYLSCRYNGRCDGREGENGGTGLVSSPGIVIPPDGELKAGRKNITPRRRRPRRVDCGEPNSDAKRRPMRRMTPFAG